MNGLTKIISGAQTGADRAALDWAIFRDIPHGGWCPKGRKAEDGKIPPAPLLPLFYGHVVDGATWLTAAEINLIKLAGFNGNGD